MLATAGVVVAAFLCWLLLLTPKSMHSALAVYPGYSHLGDRVFLFHRLTELSENPPSGEVRIAIIGASSARESIWTPDSFAKRVSAAIGKPVSAVELTAAGQQFITSWSLVENTLCGDFDIAVLAVNLGRFTAAGFRNPARVIGYRSAAVDAYLGAQVTSERFLFNNTDFIFETLYRAAHTPLFYMTGKSRIVKKKNAFKRHRFVGKRPRKPRRLTKVLQNRADIYARGYDHHAASNFAFLEGIVDVAQKCEGKLILIDTPRHPWILEKEEFKSYQTTIREHRAAIEAFAAKHGLAYIDPNQSITYKWDDMRDQSHLRVEATIQATSATIADGVANHFLAEEKEREFSAIR